MIGGYEHEWPAAFEAFLARELVGRDAVDLVRLGELTEAPALLAAGPVETLVVQAERLGVKELLLLQECRRVSPRTSVVVVATTGRFGMKSALEGGATAFLSWPAPAEVVRQALRGGQAPMGAAPAGGDRALEEEAGAAAVGVVASGPRGRARGRRSRSAGRTNE